MKTLTLFAVGGNGGRGQYERALQLLHAGRVQLDRLVTHRYSLEDAALALDANHNRREGSIKVVLTP